MTPGLAKGGWQRLWKDYGFVATLGAVIGLAWLFPEPAASGGILRSEVTTKLGVAVIFFVQGLVLPTNQLTGGLQPWRLHAFTLGWNYLLFPLLTGIILLLATPILPPAAVPGFWFLAILPTTVSSAISLTISSGGHSPPAIVSCVTSNLLAVPIVPTLCVVFFQSAGGADVPLGPLLGKLALLIALPLAIGQAARQVSPALVALAKPRARATSNGIIFFMVHVAFANSIQSGFWDDQNPAVVLLVLAVTLLLMAAAALAIWVSSGWLKLAPATRLAAFYCASQKSLATGLPLATSIFATLETTVPLSVILLPLLCYHPCQLILGAALAGRWARHP